MKAPMIKTLALLAAALFLTTMAGGETLAARSNPVVKLQTSLGDIEVELYPEKAPKSVENFLSYVNKGFYNGTVFHRIINGFMIQGGGLNDKMQLKAIGSPIQNEADNGLTNDEYTLAMARTMDPHSATAQFFINVADNDFLNHKGKDPQGWGYAVFGKVIKGQDVVEKIKAVETTTKGMHQDVPVTPVVIEKAEVVQE
ncbi:MAG: peptidyl-prolyl cis-trans isomerase [Proteobacteria bacterium]|nr:peptidyl-prolyl cis-trans isomerase [Pseudomonadota bacterium]MBU1451657.1 peptidyl-prolyl cis-trans isomerase [Pseudomonadota bacterium]